MRRRVRTGSIRCKMPYAIQGGERSELEAGTEPSRQRSTSSTTCAIGRSRKGTSRCRMTPRRAGSSVRREDLDVEVGVLDEPRCVELAKLRDTGQPTAGANGALDVC